MNEFVVIFGWLLTAVALTIFCLGIAYKKSAIRGVVVGGLTVILAGLTIRAHLALPKKGSDQDRSDQDRPNQNLPSRVPIGAPDREGYGHAMPVPPKAS